MYINIKHLRFTVDSTRYEIDLVHCAPVKIVLTFKSGFPS